jgi:hypothetical protein
MFYPDFLFRRRENRFSGGGRNHFPGGRGFPIPANTLDKKLGVHFYDEDRIRSVAQFVSMSFLSDELTEHIYKCLF